MGERFMYWLRCKRVEWVLQCGDETDIQDAIELARTLEMGRVSALFDASGGRGIEPFRWPVSPVSIRFGFAGGIGPDNLVEVLRDIGPREAPFWIDMESGVRTDDRFDLAKVRAVLEAAKPFVEGAAIP